MSEANFKSELLKQNGKSAVDEEVSRLREIIAGERRRVRRLLFWTVGVWVVWFLMISLSLVIPVVLAHSGPTQATTQPVSTTPVPSHPPGILVNTFKAVYAIVFLAACLGLPVAGIVLAIMLIVSRHTASRNQVLASLASIDAQLRMLGAPGLKS